MKMKRIFGLFLILFIFSSLPHVAFTQSPASRTNFPRIDPDQKALDFYKPGSGAGAYSWTELARIALWASGDTAASRLDQIRTVVTAINSSPRFPSAGKDRAEFILDYMHRNLLRTYSNSQTGIDIILSNGRYNCVSSAVLFMILCKSAGLDVNAVVTKDHAFAAVNIDGEFIDVETTNRYGFDPGNRREFHDQFGKVTGFAYVPQRNYRDRQAIGSIELISLILWNRIADLERRNRFTEAVPLAVDRLFLLNGAAAIVNSDSYSALFEEPYRSLLDRLLNYGSSLLRAGKEDDGLLWAALASPKYPDEKRWSEFVFAAANNRLNKYLKAGRIAEAGNFLDSQRPFLDSASYAHLENFFTDTDLATRTGRIRNIADGDAVIAAIEEARINNKISDTGRLTCWQSLCRKPRRSSPPRRAGTGLGPLNILRTPLPASVQTANWNRA